MSINYNIILRARVLFDIFLNKSFLLQYIIIIINNTLFQNIFCN